MKKKKFDLSGPFAFILAILVLLIFVPVNLIAGYYDKVYDMTPNKKYTLNEKTVQLLDETKDKEIDIYYLGKLQDLKDNPEYLSLYHTLTELDARDNITLHCIDPDKDVETASSLDPTGILGVSELDIFVKCGTVIKKVQAERIFQKVDGIQHYDGEELISGALKTVTNGSLPTVYFLQGHGEKSIYDPGTENYSLESGYGIYAQQLYAKNYDVKELDLDKEGAIPSNTAILLLAGPQQDLTDNETSLINDYLDQGGSMSFLLDPCETEGRFKNIEKLLEKFGILMDYNLVTETLPVLQFRNREGQQDPAFMRVEFIDNTAAENDYTEDLTSELIMLIDNGAYNAGISNTRSFTYLPEASFPGASYTEVSPLIASTPDFTNGIENYTVESTPMGGNEATAAEAEQLSGTELYYGFYSYNKLSGGKITVFGTSEPVDTEAMCPTTSGVQTLILFSDTWLYDTDESLGVGTKLNSYDYMKFPSAKKAESTIAVIVVFPLAVALVGLIVWLRRRHA